MKRLLNILFMWFVTSTVFAAADGSWTNNSNGNWSDTNNWLGGIVATGANQTAYFTNNITLDRTVSNDWDGLNIGHLRIGINGSSNWYFNTGSLYLTNSITPSITVSNLARMSFVLGGLQGFIKDGAGTLELQQYNTYSNTLIITNGTVKLVAPSIGTAPITNGLIYWLDASTTNYIVMDTTNKVSQWTDRSGTGHTFTQTTLANRPIYTNNVYNGLGAIRFAGGTTNLINTDTATNRPVTVFIVNMVETNSGTLNGIWGSSNPSDKGIRLQSSTNWQAVGGDANDFNNGVGGAVYVNGDTTRFFAKTNLHVLTEFRGASFNNAFVNTSVGGYFGGRYFHGDVCEMVVYDRVLDIIEQNSVEGYLMNKYGLTSYPIFNNLLPSYASVAIATNGTLDLNGGNQEIQDLSGAGVFTNSYPRNIHVVIHSGTYSGLIGVSNDIHKVDNGTLTLSGTNTFMGDLGIYGGTLSVNKNRAMGDVTATCTLFSNVVLQTTGTFTNTHAITISSTGTIDVATGTTLTITNAGFGTASASTALYKTNSGTLTVAFTVPSLFKGTIYVNQGTLLIGTGNDNSVQGNLTIRSNAVTRLLVANPIINSCVVTIDAGGLFDVGGLGDVVGYLAGSGLVTNNSAITLDLGSITNNFSGTMKGVGSLILRGGNGSGTQILSGSNLFTSAVDVQKGILIASGTNSLGSVSSVRVRPTGFLTVLGRSINDSASLRIDSASGGYGRVNVTNTETVYSLLYNGLVQVAGTYGSLASSAQFKDNNRFSGTGVIKVQDGGKIIPAEDNKLWQ